MAAAKLDQRFADITARLDALEHAAKQKPVLALALRWGALEARLEALMAKAGHTAVSGPARPAHPLPAAQPPRLLVDPEPPADATPTHQRLHRELVSRAFTDFKFVRVPGGYYEQPLEWRQAQLGAASIDHLCKSIVSENTRAHPSIVHEDPLHPHNWANPHNSRYYVLIVQYSARLHFDKIKALIYKLNEGQVSRQYFNFRLAPEDVNDALTGYEHNAVSPIGMPVEVPILMSDRITQLDPDFFFVGGGEVDLKLGLRASEFVARYKPIVADITY